MQNASLGTAPALLTALAPVLGAQRGNRLKRIAQRLRLGFPDNYLSGVGLARADDLATLFGSADDGADPYGAIRAHFGRTDIDLTMERILYGDMRSYLVDDILVKVDRASMANSLEARAPLLDQQLIDFCARLPYAQKYRRGVGKYLFRSIARDLLPREVLDKPKQGFAIPIDHWFRTDLKPMLQDVLGSRAFRERGIFSTQGVQRLMAEHFAGTHQWGEMLWLLLTFETWAQRFGYHDSNAALEEVAL
jgi:asparagine synthase (glutamine-hydrolysing)